MIPYPLDTCLRYLFPDAQPGDWRLLDEGDGPRIHAWNRPEPQPTPAQIAAVAEPARIAAFKAAEIALYIETREKMCARVAGIAQRLARAGDTAGASSCDAVVNALLDVPAHASVTGATDIASLRLAIKTRYLAAVGLASLSAKAEFRRYDK